MSDNKSDLYVPTGTLGLPLNNNYTYNSSANIAPHFHVGPRTYSENGYVPHPLQLTGGQGGAAFNGDKKVKNKAGANATAPGGLDALVAFPSAL